MTIEGLGVEGRLRVKALGVELLLSTQGRILLPNPINNVRNCLTLLHFPGRHRSQSEKKSQGAVVT